MDEPDNEEGNHVLADVRGMIELNDPLHKTSFYALCISPSQELFIYE